jgi:hypothetical protein
MCVPHARLGPAGIILASRIAAPGSEWIHRPSQCSAAGAPPAPWLSWRPRRTAARARLTALCRKAALKAPRGTHTLRHHCVDLPIAPCGRAPKQAPGRARRPPLKPGLGLAQCHGRVNPPAHSLPVPCAIPSSPPSASASASCLLTRARKPSRAYSCAWAGRGRGARPGIARAPGEVGPSFAQVMTRG